MADEITRQSVICNLVRYKVESRFIILRASRIKVKKKKGGREGGAPLFRIERLVAD